MNNHDVNRYIRRLSDEILERKLKGLGAVVIVGSKWCGKTTSAKQVAGSVVSFATEREAESGRIILENRPSALFDKETPILIDEWQVIPSVWDEVRKEVDERSLPGQFILTGSAVPPNLDEHTLHSGTGRFSWLRMRPMSLYESGDSDGAVSIKELFDSNDGIYAKNRVDIASLCFLICRGGWPYSLSLDAEIALDVPNDYTEGVINSDVSRVDGVNRNPERTRNILRSYARNQGTHISLDVIRNDIKENGSKEIDTLTIQSYLNALRRIFVIEDVKAWNPNLRSKRVVRVSDTRYFVDPSIATAVLNIGPGDLENDLNTLGLFLETLCIRDLRVYAQSLGGDIFHYLDNKGLECDAVMHLRDGRYALIEIKLGGQTLIEKGAATLKKLREEIDTTRMKSPSFLMVLTGLGDCAYRRDDGVYVVPVGCLRN